MHSETRLCLIEQQLSMRWVRHQLPSHRKIQTTMLTLTAAADEQRQTEHLNNRTSQSVRNCNKPFFFFCDLDHMSVRTTSAPPCRYFTARRFDVVAMCNETAAAETRWCRGVRDAVYVSTISQNHTGVMATDLNATINWHRDESSEQTYIWVGHWLHRSVCPSGDESERHVLCTCEWMIVYAMCI